jgi:hypothetical protein
MKEAASELLDIEALEALEFAEDMLGMNEKDPTE